MEDTRVNPVKQAACLDSQNAFTVQSKSFKTSISENKPSHLPAATEIKLALSGSGRPIQGHAGAWAMRLEPTTTPVTRPITETNASAKLDKSYSTYGDLD
jgi:hypothetical protein